MVKSLIVRFLKIAYNDETDKYDGAKYLAGFTASGNFDEYTKMFMTMKECDIKIKGEYYIVDDVMFFYGGEEDSVPCLNVYLI